MERPIYQKQESQEEKPKEINKKLGFLMFKMATGPGMWYFPKYS
jgi:hypothetical protein